MGAQKNGLNEMILLSTPKQIFKLMDKNIFTILRPFFVNLNIWNYIDGINDYLCPVWNANFRGYSVFKYVANFLLFASLLALIVGFSHTFVLNLEYLDLWVLVYIDYVKKKE